MKGYLAGGIAGFLATLPMTLVMTALHRRLPKWEQYPLPPRQITEEVAEKIGVESRLDEGGMTAATLVNHFAYGAAGGALYAPIADKLPGPPAAKGIAYGLAIWAGSYLGWLPAAGILPPATRAPAERNALMIAAHIVWGAVLGAAAERLA